MSRRDLSPRRLLVAAVLCCAALPSGAQAAPPTVHELAPLVAAPDRVPPRRVPARAPLAGFRHGPGATGSSLRVTDSSEVGNRTNGKILAVDLRQGRYSCSGTALNTPSKSIVLTAGHCAIEKGSAGRRIVFVPAYSHGVRPFGTFSVSGVYVMRQWRHGENPDFDVAAMKVRPSALGALTDVVGGRGYETGKSRSSAFQIFGYPAAALRGEELRSCRAHGLGSDPLTFAFFGPPTLPSSCDMAAGASGGAWIIGGQYISGVTSYSYVGRPQRLYSPYFGPEVGNFLRRLP
jgi:V8-like Glu-specific endopeptidase